MLEQGVVRVALGGDRPLTFKIMSSHFPVTNRILRTINVDFVCLVYQLMLCM